MSKKPKRYRWVCPECGKGALGSQRPRSDNVVRFCFPCSTKSGFLVARTCPALERVSGRKAEARKGQAKKKRAREKAKRNALWVYGGFDLAKEAKRMCKHPEVGLIRVPQITIQRRRDGFSSGNSQGGRIVLSLPARCSPGEALGLLAHELAHEATRRQIAWMRRGHREWHGARWKAVFTALAVDLYGADPAASDNYHQFHQYVCDAIDTAIEEAA